MVDASLVLEAIVAVSIAAGAFFAVLELRGIGKDRRSNTVVDIYQTFVASDMTDAYAKAMNCSSESGVEVEKECSYSSLVKVAGFYESVGYLTRKKLVDPNVVIELLPIVNIWQKMKPWLLYDRARSDPGMWREFEYLAAVSETWETKANYVATVTAEIDALEKRKKRKGV